MSPAAPIPWYALVRGLLGEPPTAARLAADRDARRLAASVLSMEVIVFWLAIIVSVVQTDIAMGVAIAIGGGLAVACIAICATLRRRRAFLAGTLVQLGAVACGVAVPVMFFVGALFAGLWVAAVRLGLVAVRDAAPGDQQPVDAPVPRA